MNLILFGFKGAGKSYFGKKVANHLSCPFTDTDALFGESPRDLYLRVGEVEFRKREKELLQAVKPGVIAVGGGTVLDSENVKFLQNLGKMIYLDASLERVKRNGALLAEGNIEEIYYKRKPLYEAIVAKRIVLDDLTDEEVLSEIINAI